MTNIGLKSRLDAIEKRIACITKEIVQQQKKLEKLDKIEKC